MTRIFPLLLCLFLVAAVGAQEGAESPRQMAPDAAGAAIATRKLEEAKQRVQKTGENRYEIGTIKINSKTREITFPATLNMTEGLLEYALVHENGKTHESLLSTKVSPTELNLALLLANYEAHLGDAAKHLPDLLPATRSLIAQPMENPGANRVNITLIWSDKDGREKRVPMAEWIHDKKTGKPLLTPYWSYTGSLVREVGFAAEFDGSVIGIYFDMIAMINCPVPGNVSDEVWQVETQDVPALETPIVVSITPYIAEPQAP
ncbi:hypothetical protein FEM03_10155 [Phragmitibacter flavus]|uniref:DUF4412 domain-containing protein n=1 Tax=Phragmitibacter flavus TaxID=2576071 RepID=A0A5R8KGE5_9BACT|nr:YdjY domain-containing protein [Phragmitibacter flavus]TLD70669.1 hypothetical protein FEM03_10155 [Phragmitibacter flavus]